MQKYSQSYHFIYDKTTGKSEKNHLSNAINLDLFFVLKSISKNGEQKMFIIVWNVASKDLEV